MRKKSKARRKLIEESDDLELQKNSDIENDITPTNNLQDNFLKDNLPPMTDDDILTDASNGTAMKGTKRKRKISSNNAVFKRIKKNETVIQETPSSSLGSAAKTFYCSQNLYESVNECDPNIMQSIVPSVAKNVASYSQMKISQCSTTQTTNDSRTISGLDRTPVSKSFNLEQDDGLMQNQGYIMSQLYNSQTLLSQQPNTNAQNQEYQMTQLYDSSSFVFQNQQSSPTSPHQSRSVISEKINDDLQSSQNSVSLAPNINEHIVESTDCSATNSGEYQNLHLDQSKTLISVNESHIGSKITFKTVAQVHGSNDTLGVEDNLSGRSTNETVHVSMINNPPTGFVMNKASNMSFNQGNLRDKHLIAEPYENDRCVQPIFDFHQDSLPLTPVDADPLVLPPSLLLSNYCSEYDKAYTIKDLKPNQYRNYRHNEALRSLKEHLDSKIPPHMTLRDFYKITNLP